MNLHTSPYQVMPPLSDEDYANLKADIEARGVLVPVEMDELGNILDGHHRAKICDELGITFPRLVREGFTDEEKWTHARQLNIARRHLDREQKRGLIADQLRQTPQFSDRRIANDLGVSDKTVGSVREELVASAEIPHSQPIIDKGGFTRVKPQLVKVKLIDDSDAGKAGAKERAKEIQPVRGTTGTGENEWYTPVEHIERARRALGTIDLDPASSELANETVRAGAFFDEEANGLAREWHGNVWLNPPYAQPAIEHFARKTVAEWESGRITAAIVLTHNYTDTIWFQLLAKAATALCFTKGRIKFYNPEGEIAAPTQGQAFFYLGNDPARFFEHFRDVGFVVEVRHE